MKKLILKPKYYIDKDGRSVGTYDYTPSCTDSNCYEDDKGGEMELINRIDVAFWIDKEIKDEATSQVLEQ